MVGHIELLRIHADIVIAKRLSDGRVPLLLFNIAIEVCRQVLQGKFKIHRKGRRERGKYGHPLEILTISIKFFKSMAMQKLCHP